jgi:hypothetical protein
LFRQKEKDWVKLSSSPKSISSLKIFVEEFLKYWGTKYRCFEDTYQDLLAVLQEEGIIGLLKYDEVANATVYDEGTDMKEFHDKPMSVSSLITRSVIVKEDIGDDLNENHIRCNIYSRDEESEGYCFESSNHDDIAAKEESPKGLLLIASFDNRIGEQSAEILDQEEESILHLMKDDRGIVLGI